MLEHGVIFHKHVVDLSRQLQCNLVIIRSIILSYTAKNKASERRKKGGRKEEERRKKGRRKEGEQKKK